MKKTGDEEWRRAIEYERLRIERDAAEFRMNEAVARLAIDLGKNGPGRGGKRFTPDVHAAARLLTDAALARDWERGRTDREVQDQLTDWFNERELEENPPVLWHHARRGVVSGSGGVVSCAVLCCPGADADTRIHVGRLFRDRWERLGTWEVMRDEGKFRKIVLVALEKLMASKQKGSGPRENPKKISEDDISKVVQMGGILPEFFGALVSARRELGSGMNKGSAGGEVKPPRGKRKRL
jgi:hypothetical protein